ncbi:hypothetical protein ACVWXS_002677 [Lysinibacillus sp. TE18511]
MTFLSTTFTLLSVALILSATLALFSITSLILSVALNLI